MALNVIMVRLVDGQYKVTPTKEGWIIKVRVGRGWRRVAGEFALVDKSGGEAVFRKISEKKIKKVM